MRLRESLGTCVGNPTGGKRCAESFPRSPVSRMQMHVGFLFGRTQKGKNMEFGIHLDQPEQWTVPDTLICLFSVILLIVLLIVIAKRARKWTAAELCLASLCIALSFVLSFVKLWSMPTGGSVTLASMLPIMLFSMLAGPVKGLFCGLIYGLLQCLQGGWIVHPVQFLLDYPLAFSMLGLAGIRFGKKNAGAATRAVQLSLSMLMAALGRALCATLAGYFFWNTRLLASLVYNGTYLIPDIAICILLAIPIAPRLKRVSSIFYSRGKHL